MTDDIISTVHESLHQPITHEEWNDLSLAQQERVACAWEEAVSRSIPPPSPKHSVPSDHQPYSDQPIPYSSSTRAYPEDVKFVLDETSSSKPTPKRSSRSESWIGRVLRCLVGKTREDQDLEDDQDAVFRRSREVGEGVLRIDWMCGMLASSLTPGQDWDPEMTMRTGTTWVGLVRDDVLARRRGIVEREDLEQCWSLLLE